MYTPHSPYKTLNKNILSYEEMDPDITPKLTASYIHVYEATQYTQFPQPHILYSSFTLHVSLSMLFYILIY